MCVGGLVFLAVPPLRTWRSVASLWLCRRSTYFGRFEVVASTLLDYNKRNWTIHAPALSPKSGFLLRITGRDVMTYVLSVFKD